MGRGGRFGFGGWRHSYGSDAGASSDSSPAECPRSRYLYRVCNAVCLSPFFDLHQLPSCRCSNFAFS
jgi:hypothetical protein